MGRVGIGGRLIRCDLGGGFKATSSLADLLNAIPLLTDSDFRAKAYERVKPLVESRQTDTQVRRAAIPGLVSMNREPEAVFSSLAALIDRGEKFRLRHKVYESYREQNGRAPRQVRQSMDLLNGPGRSQWPIERRKIIARLFNSRAISPDCFRRNKQSTPAKN